MTNKLQDRSEVVKKFIKKANYEHKVNQNDTGLSIAYCDYLEVELKTLLTTDREAVIADYQTNFEQKHIASAVEVVRAEIRQTLRELRLLDYYCKCHDMGHVLAMPREDYDKLLQAVTHKTE